MLLYLLYFLNETLLICVNVSAIAVLCWSYNFINYDISEIQDIFHYSKQSNLMHCKRACVNLILTGVASYDPLVWHSMLNLYIDKPRGLVYIIGLIAAVILTAKFSDTPCKGLAMTKCLWHQVLYTSRLIILLLYLSAVSVLVMPLISILYNT